MLPSLSFNTLSAVSRRFQVSRLVCSDRTIWKTGMPNLQKVIFANHLRIFLRKRISGDLQSIFCKLRHSFEKMKPFHSSASL